MLDLIDNDDSIPSIMTSTVMFDKNRKSAYNNDHDADFVTEAFSDLFYCTGEIQTSWW